jgi:predicted nucleotidyltransferase
MLTAEEKARRIQKALPEIVRRLREALAPECVYLFGSAAYGSITPDSEVDLLVVVPDSPLSYYERGALAYRALRHIGVPIDVMVYTRDEFHRRASLPISFKRTVCTKGRVLYAA